MLPWGFSCVNSHNYLTNRAWKWQDFHFLEIDGENGSVIVRQTWNKAFSAQICVYVRVFCLYIRVLALNKI